MTAATVSALLPYLVLAGGTVLLLLAVAWLRSHVVAFAGALLILVMALAVTPLALSAAPQNVDGLLAIDGYALFFQALFAVTAIATAVLSYRYLRPRASHRQEFYILLVIATLGAAVTASAEHFAGFLLGLEVLSISLYAMIAYPQEGRQPLEAAAKYLVLSGAATSTMLFGMALIYLVTGTLQFAPAAEVARTDELILAVGQAMLLIGVFFKLSLVPFHMWTPDVYQGAPAPVTGFVATASKAAVFAALLRYALDAGILDGGADPIRTVIVVVAVLSMVGGNLLALLQTNIKRLLAYSSIAHMGYLMIAVVVSSTPAVRDTPRSGRDPDCLRCGHVAIPALARRARGTRQRTVGREPGDQQKRRGSAATRAARSRRSVHRGRSNHRLDAVQAAVLRVKRFL